MATRRDPLVDLPPVERRGAIRSRTVSLRALRRLAKVEAPLVRLRPLARPRTRADCVNGPRPCPWVGCRWHLYLEVKPNGSIRFLHPGRELEDLRDTCALDVAGRGGVSLVEVGELLQCTRSRAQQMVERALERLRAKGGLP